MLYLLYPKLSSKSAYKSWKPNVMKKFAFCELCHWYELKNHWCEDCEDLYPFFTKSIKRLPTSDAYYVTIIVIAGVKRYLISHESSSTTMNILINLIRWNRMPARPATAVWFSYHWMMFTAADRTFKNTPLIFKVLIWCSSLAILVNFLIYMGSMKPAFHWNIEITVHDKKGKLISYKNNIFVEMYVIILKY